MSRLAMLAYYAQREESYSGDHKHFFLKHLKDERKAMRESCEKSGLLFLSREPDEATIEKIAEDLKDFRNDVVIFHYSGHAGPENLFLQSQSANPSALANLLSQCPNLRLVFLNGCCTRNQIYHLFKNKVRAVIATNYSIKDIDAYVFAAAFYKQLLKQPYDSMHHAFVTAVSGFNLNTKFSALLPNDLKGSPQSILPSTEISNALRGGIDTETNDLPAWGFHVLDDADPVITGEWLPVVKKKIDLSRAYTCGRDTLSDIFREHCYRQAKQKKTLHYFIIDENKKSLEGISVKLLFENIIRKYNNAEVPGYHYPCDPNLPLFRENIFRLYSDNSSKEEIIEKLYGWLKGNIVNTVMPVAKTFRDLYEIIPVKKSTHVFIFISIKKEAFISIRDIIKDFIRESVETDTMEWIGSEKINRPLLLFFWHIETPKTLKIVELTSFRKKVAKSFSVPFFKDYITFLHEKDMKPVPMPKPDDLENWINFNEVPIDHLNPLKRILMEHGNVMTLENKLKTIIQQQY